MKTEHLVYFPLAYKPKQHSGELNFKMVILFASGQGVLSKGAGFFVYPSAFFNISFL